MLITDAAPDAGIDACTSNKSNPLYPSCANTTYAYAASSGGWNVGAAADPLSPWLHKATDWVPAFLHYIQDTWKPSGGGKCFFSQFHSLSSFLSVERLLTLDLHSRCNGIWFRGAL
jgi:hypothetical protein